MNERTLYKTWQKFAEANDLEFQQNEQYIIGGIITELTLAKDNQALIKAKLAKMGTSLSYNWTKLFKPGNPDHFIKDKFVRSTTEELQEALDQIKA